MPSSPDAIYSSKSMGPIRLPATEATPQRRLSNEYAQLDVADPSISLSWLSSILLFGASFPKSAADPRYRALAKLKAVAAQHGIEHITPREYLLAVSVHTALLNRRPRRNHPQPPSPSSRSVRPEHLQLFHHMLRHAESIYGLPLNVASAPGVSLTKVTDRGIICRRTGLSPSDLLMTQFTTRAFLPAHYLAVDRSIKAIVICIRGTANIVDSLTDAAATQDPLSVRSGGREDGDVVEGFGHTGMVRSARNLFAKIRERTLAAVKGHKGYDLLLTGHSMGAATAALLALIMLDDPDFPHATAVCIAPPPCMTYELAEETATNTITLVNGPDIVPRLSVGRMLPFFATARYVAGLTRSQKALLALGLIRSVVDWRELETHNEKRIAEMKRLHAGMQLYVPGKVFQLVRREQMNASDPAWNRLFRRQDVELVPLTRRQFLSVKGRERGMFIAHAPFSYRTSLLLALKGMGSGPLKKMHASSVLRNLFNLPTSRLTAESGDSLDRQESLMRLLEELALDVEDSLSISPRQSSMYCQD